MKAKVPFIEKLSGHAIAKLLYKGSLGTMKIRLVDNLTVTQIINNTPSTMYLPIPRRIDRHSRPYIPRLLQHQAPGNALQPHGCPQSILQVEPGLPI